MKNRINMAMLVMGLVSASMAYGQCMVISTYKFPTTPTVVVYKVLSASYSCALTMSNAFNCSPTTIPQNTNFLLATANISATPSPSCVWACMGCGTVTIDGQNGGLPVELLEVEVED